jgi:Pyruvate/2-oxoacid:ferredoxin oxidoreductase delta subunit
VLVTLNEEISLPVPEQVLPYSRARDIVLRNPDHIVALDCPCRASRPSPCRPLDICLIVGEPFASFVVEHNPGRARWISQQRAEQILHEEHERGHVHHAFFKDAMLERFYAICNCCSCCCGAMQAFRNGTPMLASSGYVSRIDPQSCIYCERCADACPFDAVSMGDAAAWVDDQLCMGCGVCVSRCDWNAVELVRDPSKGEPLAVHELMVSAG